MSATGNPAKAKIGVLGASGYTGAELLRLLLCHPSAEIVLLTAERRAGKTMAEVFAQFAPFALPTVQSKMPIGASLTSMWRSAPCRMARRRR